MNLNRRELALAALSGIVTAAIKPGTAAAQTIARDEYWYIHPELRQFVRDVAPLIAKLPKLSLETLADSRKGLFPPTPPLPDVPWEKRATRGVKGQPDVTVYVINAKPGSSRGGILHTHGGGFVSGSVEGDLAWLQSVARDVDCCIVSVDYRLAPETKFQGSMEDNYAGLLWLHENAAELGVDRNRLAVMGESAGGGHAALLALTARDRGEVPLAFQCLTYPMLDDRTGSSRAVPHPIGVFGWKADDNVFGWRAFLGLQPGTKHVPTQAVPSRHKDLSGLPATWIGVGSIDLFVGEDMEYARRLLEAGVQVETLVSPGAFHGFDRFAGQVPIARAFNESRLAALKSAFRKSA